MDSPVMGWSSELCPSGERASVSLIHVSVGEVQSQPGATEQWLRRDVALEVDLVVSQRWRDREWWLRPPDSFLCLHLD